jgi:NAD(P)H-hydrate repair Nnr-like enzyme with NAD(P)H-hydrate epimerase domain
MEQAGAAVAREAALLLPRLGRVAVCCGPGNNGGDGFVAARVLAAQKFGVALGLLGARDELRGDAALAAKGWTGKILAVEELDLDPADLVIDALRRGPCARSQWAGQGFGLASQ